MAKSKFTRYTKNNMSQSKQIAKNKKAISALQKAPELKVVSYFKTFIPATVGASQYALDELLQGTGDQERIGDVVTLKYLDIRVAISAIGLTYCRTLIVLDKQNNNSVAPIPLTNLFDNATGNLQACNSVYNTDFVGKDKRYVIYYDTGMTILDNNTSPFKKVFRVKRRLGWKVHFTGNTGTSTDINDKCLSIIHISADVLNSWTFSSNLSYTDM